MSSRKSLSPSWVLPCIKTARELTCPPVPLVPLLRRGVDNPVDDGSSHARRMSFAGHKEVIENEPWFVGSANSAVVEKGLESGMVGDYVVRESVSTPGA